MAQTSQFFLVHWNPRQYFYPMPELPEVETVRRGLAATVLNRPLALLDIHLERTVVCLPDFDPETSLNADEFSSIGRHGKYLVFRTAKGRQFLVHLRMTGQLLYHRAGDEPLSHVRASFVFREGSRLDFRDVRTFGRIRQIPDTADYRDFIRCGSDALEITDRELTTLQKLYGRSALKSFLLDQRRIAGIGNIYADEICHRLGKPPDSPLQAVRPEELNTIIKDILLAAIKNNGTTFSDYRNVNGRAGNNRDSLRVYGRKDCGSCGGELVRMKVAGRTTRFCPFCQS